MNLKELFAQFGVEVDGETIAKMEPMVKVKAKAAKVNAKFEATGKEFEGKVPTQMKQCVEALGDDAVDMKAWTENLTKVEGFRTQQAPAKIVAFYRKRLVDEGYVKVVQ